MYLLLRDVGILPTSFMFLGSFLKRFTRTVHEVIGNIVIGEGRRRPWRVNWLVTRSIVLDFRSL